jgi:2-oxoacid:acceptor oxidoreductase gamma subunit (pyruvate/2-ketoisovalerate family)
LKKNSIEVVFNGRGGQGVVTSAEIFARAAAYEGRNVQSVPHFGAERRGAPVVAYARISDDKIWLREPVSNPDVLVVLDQSVMSENKIAHDMKTGGTIVLNSPKGASEFKSKFGSEELRIYAVDATGIATKILGRSIVSTVILGALSKATGLVTLDSLSRAIQYGLPKTNIDLNMRALEMAATASLA